jgi:hypothetical protein
VRFYAQWSVKLILAVPAASTSEKENHLLAASSGVWVAPQTSACSVTGNPSRIFTGTEQYGSLPSRNRFPTASALDSSLNPQSMTQFVSNGEIDKLWQG